MSSARTISEKILARGRDRKEVSPGELHEVRVDVTLSHERTVPPFFEVFDGLGIPIWDAERGPSSATVISPPSKTFSADLIQTILEFCRKHRIENYYHGLAISHQLFPNLDFVMPGETLVGTDSPITMQESLRVFSSGIGSTEMA